MADIKRTVAYAALGVTIVLVAAGVSVRAWLKGQVEAAGSPTAFAAQTVLSSLDRKVHGELAGLLRPDHQERLQAGIRKAQGLSRRFSQPQTIRLFEILDGYEQRTKRDGGCPSEETILSLISDLDSLNVEVGSPSSP